MEKDNLLSYLPKDNLLFYQGLYYGLNEILKKIPILHTSTRDIIKLELFNLRIKVIELTTQQQPAEG